MNEQLIILDLDETLVYATQHELHYAYEFMAGPYFVYARPYLDEFISYCFDNFSVAVWTSSGSDYAEAVTNEIFSNKQSLKFIWSRERCVRRFDHHRYDYFYIKDLKKVKRNSFIGFPLERVIMVDNTPRKLIRNYGNLIKVSSFEGDLRDDELLYLMEYLDQMKFEPNIRRVDKRGWIFKTNR